MPAAAAQDNSVFANIKLSRRPVPTPIPNFTKICQVASDMKHSVGRADTFHLWTWMNFSVYFTLFDDAFPETLTMETASYERIMHEWWIAKDAAGSDRGLI
jgi:hypothetical protein